MTAGCSGGADGRLDGGQVAEDDLVEALLP